MKQMLLICLVQNLMQNENCKLGAFGILCVSETHDLLLIYNFKNFYIRILIDFFMKKKQIPT